MNLGAMWRWIVRNKAWKLSGVVVVIVAVGVGSWLLLSGVKTEREMSLDAIEKALEGVLHAEQRVTLSDWDEPLHPAERVALEAGLKRIRVSLDSLERRIEALQTDVVKASRVFAGPQQYPPRDFAAYGIVAFPSAASTHDAQRYLYVCQAYMAVLPHTRELPEVPQRAQMVTVWPVTSAALADDLNADSRSEVDAICERAVNNYHSVIARRAIKQAEAVGAAPYLRGNGPYLLAWSPGATKGAPDALVLVADLSYMDDYDDLRDVFLKWAEDIEQNPDLWRQGWAVERVRQAIRVWADRFGAQILAFVTGE